MRRIDFLKSTMNTNAAFIRMAMKPNITIVPSTAGRGMTLSVMPVFLWLSSTKRNTTEMRKQMLAIKTIREKKRINIFVF